MSRQRKFRVTSSQLDRFLEDLVAGPGSPLGDHLTDSEFVEYSLEQLADHEVERIDRHLASCPDCAGELERLIEESRAWTGPEGENRLERLREKVLDAAMPIEPQELPAIVLMPRAAYQPARAAARTAEPWSLGRSPDGVLSWSIAEDKAGNLTIEVSSFVLEHGSRLRFQVGSWSKEVELHTVEPGQVAGRIEIARTERDSLPADQPLQVENVRA
jgi:anti-sigma factor RsiW